jgi:hypothetical protein
VKNSIIILTFLLLGCNSGTTNINNDNNIDSSYGLSIILTDSISLPGKDLTYISDLFDSANFSRGNVYIKKLNDSIFRSLYIFNKNHLVYFVGEGIITNLRDTEHYSTERYFGLKFIDRTKYSVTIEIADSSGNGVSDDRTIQYLRSKGSFGTAFAE